MKRTVVASERAEQAALISWWAIACKKYGLPEFALYAVPNGAHLAGDTRQRGIQMSILKGCGLRPGMPDLNLDVPHRNVSSIHGLRIEMKRSKGASIRSEQEAVIEYLNNVGYVAYVAYGFEDAKGIIERYLGSRGT